ncbi:MAG: electron transfer flavoprotein subunit beta/FixA family protein [bacterium]|nr:electron transfer flavoprotein subunit beta/FixA family protein [bacterium]
MKIIVCIKQVPETTSVRIDPKTNTLIREGVQSIINPFDMNAIEAALQLKESCGDGEIIAISMGPPQAEEALREAISLGVDEAILLTDRAFAGGDTLATAYTLSMAIKKLSPFDLIICGKQAIDGDTAQVGPELAEMLNLPQVCFVRKIEEIKDALMTVQRALEDGYEVVEVNLPALITVVKEINEPRLPSLRGKLAAKKKEIGKWGVLDIEALPDRVGLVGSATQVVRTFTPPPRKDRKILEGEVKNIVKELVAELKERNIVL